MRRFTILSVFVPFLFIACASLPVEKNNRKVYVTNSAEFSLLSPSCMSGELDCFQRMTAVFGEGKSQREFSFDAYVVSNKDGLSICILNEFGTTLSELFYDGESIDFDSSVFPAAVKAEYIVADFQFCLYDADALRNSLKNAGIDFEVSVEEENGEITECRLIKKDGKIISKITKKTNCGTDGKKENPHFIKCENFLRKYSYTLIRGEDSLQ